jgi:TolB-like protein
LSYQFEDYSLDADRQELRRGGELVALEPQVFDVLLYLVRNRGRVISKDDLIASVWNGRIVSESTLSSRINAARQAVGDNGEDQRLIRTIARKGVRFIGEVREGAAGGPGQAQATRRETAMGQPPGTDRPSIAVLPFANLSGDPEQEYFADGITEDLITALSQFRWLFVIARNSSFVFKGKAVDAKQIGRELGVRYLLEGSVRKAANQVRITAQLIDATTGAHLWASRFDGPLADIFDLQDQVTANVIGAIAPKLEQAEIERAKRKPTENLDAYDLYLRGVANTVPYTREGYAEALQLLRRAIDADREFAAAYGMAAWCRVTQKVNGWMADPTTDIADGARLAREAVRLGNEDAVALTWGGFSLGYLVHELEDGIAYVDRALVLNANLAAAWYLGGWLRVYYGDPEGGIERLTRAIRWSPLDPLIFRAYAGLAYAHFFAGRDEEAWVWAEKALRERPTWLTAVRIGAACHAVARRLDEARKLMARMRELDPNVRLSNLRDVIPVRRPADFEKWSDALRIAGLPE